MKRINPRRNNIIHQNDEAMSLTSSISKKSFGNTKILFNEKEYDKKEYDKKEYDKKRYDKKQYSKKNSEVLQDQTEQMERRLQFLRSQLEEEKNIRESTVKIGGSRWRSARETKGSIRNYASDVRERQKKTADSKLRRESGTLSKSVLNQKSLQGSSVMNWDIHDVVVWLQSLGLGAYTKTFEMNQINGRILLDLKPDDLDYLKISVLSHRKQILKSIGDFQKNNFEMLQSSEKDKMIHNHNSNQNNSNQNNSNENNRNENNRNNRNNNNNENNKNNNPNNKNSIVDMKNSKCTTLAPNINCIIDNTKTVETKLPTTKKTLIHWSHASPLSENKVAGQSNFPVNLADGEFDESQSHNSFLEALLSWRQNRDEPVVENVSTSSSLWSNPFFNANKENPEVPNDDVQGGILLEGKLDEELEHALFVNAVDAWRKGNLQENLTKKNSALEISQTLETSGSSTTTNEGQKQSCWHCYSLFPEDLSFKDNITNKIYCSEKCAKTYSKQYARFYSTIKQENVSTYF